MSSDGFQTEDQTSLLAVKTIDPSPDTLTSSYSSFSINI